MKKYIEASKVDYFRTAVYLLVYVSALIAGAILLIPVKWPAGFILWLLTLGVAGMLLLVAWHSRSFAYRCANCQHEFEIPFLSDLTSPNSSRGKYLKCPQCGKRGWATVLKKTRE